MRRAATDTRTATATLIGKIDKFKKDLTAFLEVSLKIIAVNVRRSIDIRDIGRPSGMFTKFASLPPGTIKISDNSMCAHLPGLPIEPCFRVQRIDQHSFRGSIAGSDYAYCDFYQRNPHTRLMSGLY